MNNVKDTKWYLAFQVHAHRRPRKPLPIRALQRFLEPPSPMRAKLITDDMPQPSDYHGGVKLFELLSIRRKHKRHFRYLSLNAHIAGYKLKRDK